jgi:hypothetical protein
MKSFLKENAIDPSVFDSIKLKCVEKISSLTKLDYSPGYGRYGAFIFLDEETEEYLTNIARESFGIDDLRMTYCQVVKYQIVDGSMPRLVMHKDDPQGFASTHVIDVCIDTTLDNWGLTIEDQFVPEKEKSVIFLFGNEDLHGRPDFPSSSEDDYVIKLFVNFAKKDFWFFKTDLNPILRKIRVSPIMLDKNRKSIIQK